MMNAMKGVNDGLPKKLLRGWFQDGFNFQVSWGSLDFAAAPQNGMILTYSNIF